MFYGLVVLAVVLTYTMFSSKSMMLGFPCVIFWAIFGGYNYTLSTTTWDINYLLFFASLIGMVPFCAFAAYALRTKKEEKAEGDQLIDEGADKEVKYIDEQPEESTSRRANAVRNRADRRRTKGIKRSNPWGLRQ